MKINIEIVNVGNGWSSKIKFPRNDNENLPECKTVTKEIALMIDKLNGKIKESKDESITLTDAAGSTLKISGIATYESKSSFEPIFEIVSEKVKCMTIEESLKVRPSILPAIESLKVQDIESLEIKPRKKKP